MLDKDFVINKFNNNRIFGISGVATAGKDSFYILVAQYLQQYGILTARFALADKLKEELDFFTTKMYGISSFTKNQQEKALIRPVMVSHGGVKRVLTRGTHWTGQITNQVQETALKGLITFITDIRYAEFENDEVFWLKSLGGKLIHISKFSRNSNGEQIFTMPPNEEEKRNDPKLKNLADILISWEVVGKPTLENSVQYVKQFIINI